MTTKLTTAETKALDELRANAESYADSNGFAQVYLDNCPSSANRRAWAGVLGSLAKKGYYRPQGDDCFGDVLVAQPADLDAVPYGC